MCSCPWTSVDCTATHRNKCLEEKEKIIQLFPVDFKCIYFYCDHCNCHDIWMFEQVTIVLSVLLLLAIVLSVLLLLTIVLSLLLLLAIVLSVLLTTLMVIGSYKCNYHTIMTTHFHSKDHTLIQNEWQHNIGK